MENGSSISSGARTASKRGKRFRKPRWKNYLNHLLNLWLYCGNVSADGLNYYGANGNEAVNLYNKSSSEAGPIAATPFLCNDGLKPLSEQIASGKANGTHKSLHTTSNFNLTVLESNDDRRWKIESESRLNRSNTSSSSYDIFDLIESVPVRKDEAMDHESNPSGRSSPLRFNGPEKIVNSEAMTSDIGRMKKSKRSGVGRSENKLSSHYNQSSNRSSLLPRNPTNQTGRKKLKSDTKAPSSEKNSTTISTRGEKKLSKVSLLGLFEMTTHLGVRWEGRSELAAAELAVRHINERGLLPGYLLELITNDTQVSRG